MINQDRIAQSLCLSSCNPQLPKSSFPLCSETLYRRRSFSTKLVPLPQFLPHPSSKAPSLLHLPAASYVISAANKTDSPEKVPLLKKAHPLLAPHQLFPSRCNATPLCSHLEVPAMISPALCPFTSRPALLLQEELRAEAGSPLSTFCITFPL